MESGHRDRSVLPQAAAAGHKIQIHCTAGGHSVRLVTFRFFLITDKRGPHSADRRVRAPFVQSGVTMLCRISRLFSFLLREMERCRKGQPSAQQ